MKLKFKAWDKVGKRMFNVGAISFTTKNIRENSIGSGMSPKSYSFKDIILHQWTEHRDKNNEDLYDGDIITAKKLNKNNVKILILTIIHSDGEFMLKINNVIKWDALTKQPNIGHCYYFHSFVGWEFEKIGNIHEEN